MTFCLPPVEHDTMQRTERARDKILFTVSRFYARNCLEMHLVFSAHSKTVSGLYRKFFKTVYKLRRQRLVLFHSA